MSHCVTCLLERLMQLWSAWGTDLAPGGGGRCLLWWEVHTWESGFSSRTWNLWGGQYSGESIWESANRRQGHLNVFQAYVEMLKALTTFRMKKWKAGRGCHIVWLLLPREWPYECMKSGLVYRRKGYDFLLERQKLFWPPQELGEDRCTECKIKLIGSEHPVTGGDQIHAVGITHGFLWVPGTLVSMDPSLHKN